MTTTAAELKRMPSCVLVKTLENYVAVVELLDQLVAAGCESTESETAHYIRDLLAAADEVVEDDDDPAMPLLHHFLEDCWALVERWGAHSRRGRLPISPKWRTAFAQLAHRKGLTSYAPGGRVAGLIQSELARLRQGEWRLASKRDDEERLVSAVRVGGTVTFEEDGYPTNVVGVVNESHALFRLENGMSCYFHRGAMRWNLSGAVCPDAATVRPTHPADQWIMAMSQGLLNEDGSVRRPADPQTLYAGFIPCQVSAEQLGELKKGSTLPLGRMCRGVFPGMDYGRLTAYLLARFGVPLDADHGVSPSWVLTTPEPDVALAITPSPGIAETSFAYVTHPGLEARLADARKAFARDVQVAKATPGLAEAFIGTAARPCRALRCILENLRQPEILGGVPVTPLGHAA